MSCDLSTKSPLVRIATNPWPGYELLFVAERLGYFEEEGLNIKLQQLSSLIDVQRIYNQGRADAMTGTVIESIIVAALKKEKTKIVLVPDYSYGGDVIISHKGSEQLKDMKGKRFGVETGSLGVVILDKALAKHGLSIWDVEFINLEQLKMKDMLSTNKIDAAVTYPPFATEILRNKDYKTIFTTKEIPNEIIDTISIRESILKQDPEWVNKFHKAWVKALNYFSENRKSALEMMAEREGLTVEEFEGTLGDLYLLREAEIKPILESKSLKENIYKTCETLVGLKAIRADCNEIVDILIYKK